MRLVCRLGYVVTRGDFEMSETESTLRKQARQFISDGVLPRRPPDLSWGGPGSNEICALCGVCVDQRAIEMELEFIKPLGQGKDVLHLHSHCFAAWEFELHALAAPRGQNGGNVARQEPRLAEPSEAREEGL
jgi:hypothetical protein